MKKNVQYLIDHNSRIVAIQGKCTTEEDEHSSTVRIDEQMTDVDVDVGEVGIPDQVSRVPLKQVENLGPNTNALLLTHTLDYDSSYVSNIKHPEKRLLSLPLERLKLARIITPDLPKTRLAEQFRAIKRPVLDNISRDVESADVRSNVVMVTSCVEAEGKTFSAVNLAISLSMEKDINVLLVDADVVKASTSSLLGVPRDASGLIDLLRDSTIEIADVVWDTDVPNLSILPCGQYHDHATELLASESLQSVLNELSMQYPDSVVVLDGPPLLLTNEARVLAQKVGQIIFVVAAAETSQNMLSDALERISGKARISLILNKATKSTWNSYGYGYRYGYGG